MEQQSLKIGELLKNGYDILKSANIDSYLLDTELLLGKVLERDRLFMLLNRGHEVSVEQAEQYLKLIELRKDKMPIKYILGECEFMGLSFLVKEGILIPRPDTEILVEQTIDEIRENNFKTVCDVCTGSGAIGVSIAKLVEDIKVSCCDISDIAYDVARKNVKRLSVEEKVKIIKSDLLEYFICNGEKYDIIVSNPPYIRRDVIETLMDDVKNYEPYIALCGGEDGLDFYRKITQQSLKVLNTNGILIFEIGYDQKEDVKHILNQYGFSDVKCFKDLAGKDRVVQGTLKICC
ncbi:peptide chain release factor N(5)-glutamine methyltransferase [Clostridium sp. DJ247]|uniref:peptide chain release factor N(5)-glutamine methyltransferase n=1 Tax=Clostridium sp. DJ247 TaxID=2726188 RepID=UPI001629F152|nr:peptide chain release factor N(5)-glutamine methyltransferase [Clostridium sp. DJ247]MBC2579877.1 peptide chain release factor N(5)-glutamine methyltransferase [Clostridium sp. DJ247]